MWYWKYSKGILFVDLLFKMESPIVKLRYFLYIPSFLLRPIRRTLQQSHSCNRGSYLLFQMTFLDDNNNHEFQLYDLWNFSTSG